MWVLREYPLPKQNDKTGAELSDHPLAIRIPLNPTRISPKSTLPGMAEATRKEPQLKSSLTGSGFSDLSNEGDDGESPPLRLLRERKNGTALRKL